jgi:hypothetical protein
MLASRVAAHRVALRIRSLLRTEAGRRRTRRRKVEALPPVTLGDHDLRAQRTPGATTGRLRNEMGSI